MREYRMKPGWTRNGGLRAVALTIATWGMVTSVSAGPVVVESNMDTTATNVFTLDFGEFGDIDGLGAERTGFIVETDIEIEVDPVVATAKLNRYEQVVEPIILPGGFDTGSIRVIAMTDTSVGTFDQFTGEFETAEDYAIYFEGDLSPFGLTSPVILSASSNGVVSVDALTVGTIAMSWDGASELMAGEEAIPFTYTCLLQNVFEPGLQPILSLGLVPDVLTLELPLDYERGLVMLAQLSQKFAENNYPTKAQRSLHAFISSVNTGIDANLMSEDDGADLNTTAAFAIDLIAGGSSSRSKSNR